jgi:hypothetical protein
MRRCKVVVDGYIIIQWMDTIQYNTIQYIMVDQK